MKIWNIVPMLCVDQQFMSYLPLSFSTNLFERNMKPITLEQAKTDLSTNNKLFIRNT